MSLDFLLKRLEAQQKAKTPDDLQAALAAAVQEAVAKVLADHAPPPQVPMNAGLLNRLRPAVVLPPPAPQPAPRKPPKPVEMLFERDANGRVRAIKFDAPDGSHHAMTVTHDADGYIKTMMIDDDPAVAWRVRRGADGRIAAVVPLSEAPPLDR